MVEQIHRKIGLPRKESSEVCETLLEIIKSTLESGEDILISGFGKFCINEKDARKGRNPATGADMMIKPRRVVTFKCSASLRNKINHKNYNQAAIPINHERTQVFQPIRRYRPNTGYPTAAYRQTVLGKGRDILWQGAGWFVLLRPG